MAQLTGTYKVIRVLREGTGVAIFGWKTVPGTPSVLAVLRAETFTVKKLQRYSPRRLVPCRTCGADVGEACIVNKGTEWEYRGGADHWHASRRRDAEQRASK